MSMELQGFAEGLDIKFISDFVEHLNLPITRFIPNAANGWTTLPKLKPKFLEATNKNVQNIVIFDANGNPAARREAINTNKQELGIEFSLFLFPNNIDPGQFEDLALKIIPDNKRNIVDCFDAYCRCINEINQSAIIPIKSKLFAYLEATGQPLKVSEVNFRNEEYWNLNSDALDALRTFLEEIIVE